MRAVIAEDELLFRAGLARLLTEGGIEVVAQAGDAEDMVRKVGAHRPDIVVTDVRMPPGNTDDGSRSGGGSPGPQSSPSRTTSRRVRRWS